MRFPSLLARRALGAVLLAGSAATAAGAQAVTVDYAPACAGGSACGTVRFGISNPGAATLTLHTFRLTAAGAATAFRASGPTTFGARDSFGPMGGPVTVSDAGRTLFIDFLADAFPFTLTGGASGFVDVDLAGRPALAGTPFSFTATGPAGTFAGAVVAIPEPATVALTGAGLLALAAVGRRRASRWTGA
jgi:hypothetical protein